MKVNTTYREIVKISYPVMIGALATTILNVTDTAFLGRVGETELGASAVGGVLYFVLAMIGISLGLGSQILIARRTGEGNDEKVGSIFDRSFVWLIILSLILFSFLEFAGPALIRKIVKSNEITEATVTFIRYRAPGLVFVHIATVFRSFYVGIARPAVIGEYSFVMAGVNVVLAYGLIFGNLGLPEMGIAGAGLASSIAELLSLLFIVLYTKLFTDLKRYRLFQFEKENDQHTDRRILSLSSPLILQNLLSMGAWFVFFVFIEKIGTHALAISNVVRAVYMVGMTPVWGFSVAANSMVSNIIGQSRQEEVMPLLNRILVLSLITSAIIVTVFLIFPREMLGIFTSDTALIKDSLGTLHVVNASMLFFTFALVSISALSGTGLTRIALYIEIVAISIYFLYISLVTFAFKGTVEAAWFSEVIYWLCTGLGAYYYIRSHRWRSYII